MTQNRVQDAIDRAVNLLVARAGFTEAQARELILEARAKAHLDTQFRNAPRLVVVQ